MSKWIFFKICNCQLEILVLRAQMQFLSYPIFSKGKNRLRISSTAKDFNDMKTTTEAIDNNISFPQILYGTAWKKDRTSSLVYQAIQNGFRGIDTACQPKHYNEAGVGEALARAYSENILRRNEIFLQTKFTSLDGQDPSKIPYDATATLENQVKQSLERSQQNLQTSYIDSILLHSPMKRFEDTMRVWRVFESFVNDGVVRYLGISNTYNIDTLKRLYEEAVIKPSFLQNRFYAESGYDRDIRQFCGEKGIKYQSFWTLTANPDIIASSAVHSLARKYTQTPEQIFFRYMKTIGVTPLSGTKSIQHMKEDLDATMTSNYRLEDDEVESIERLLTNKLVSK
eukprot:gene6167-12496_t